MAKEGLKVKYAYVDGMHFFTSASDLTKGLCAGSKDLEVAFNEVSFQINYLLKKNHGKENPKCKPSISFEKFVEWLTYVTKTPQENIETVPVGMIQWAQSEYQKAA